jgi:hypothetical protein
MYVVSGAASTAVESASSVATQDARYSGATRSSWPAHRKYGARASLKRKLKFRGAPMSVAWRTYRMGSSRPANSRQIASVSSVEALSAITSSKSASVCASSESRASRR